MKRRFFLMVSVAVALGGLNASAAPKKKPVPAGPEEIHLKAQNAFSGLGWEVNISKGVGGYRRTTAVFDTSSKRRLETSAAVSAKDMTALWKSLEQFKCWDGPTKSQDWGASESDQGSVSLAKNGKQKAFNYYESWAVATALEKFGAVGDMKQDARGKGFGKN